MVHSTKFRELIFERFHVREPSSWSKESSTFPDHGTGPHYIWVISEGIDSMHGWFGVLGKRDTEDLPVFMGHPLQDHPEVHTPQRDQPI